MKKVSDMASNVPHAAIQKHLVLAGRPLQDLLSDLFVTREQLDAIGSALLSTIDWVDILFLLTVSFCTVPLARLFCNAFRKTEKTPPGDEAVDRFQSTYTYHVALNISQIVRIATVIYVSDCFIVIAYMQGIDIALAKDVEFAPKVAKVLYMIWFAQKCMHFKRYLLGRIVNKSSKKLGNVHIFDRILDAIIYTSLVIFIMDILDVEIGSGIKSLFAFGGIGTLIFSLASKDIATLFVSGIVLSTSEKFLQGDFIELGDKTCGTVVDTGFLYTSIRGKDSLRFYVATIDVILIELRYHVLDRDRQRRKDSQNSKYSASESALEQSVAHDQLSSETDTSIPLRRPR